MEENLFQKYSKSYQQNNVDTSEENLLDKYRKQPAPTTLSDMAISPMGRVGAAILSPVVSTQEDVTRIANRIKNIGTIVGTAFNLSQGNTLTPIQSEAVSTLISANSPENVKKTGDILGARFLKGFDDINIPNLENAAKDLWSSTKSTVSSTDGMFDGIKSLLAMPVGMVSSIVGSTFGTLTGVDISGNKIRVLKPEEAAKQTQDFVANAVAVAVAGGVEKMVQGSVMQPITSAVGSDVSRAGMMANAPTRGVAAVSAMEPRLGAIGRAMMQDVAAGAAAGATQGAVANAGDPKMLAAAATGLLFAPIGVLTGWYRGVKAGGFDNVDVAISNAHDVLQLRQWQEMDAANIDGATKKVTNLLSSDDIAAALGKEPKLPLLEANIKKDYQEYVDRTNKKNDEVLKAGINSEQPNKNNFIDQIEQPLTYEQFKAQGNYAQPAIASEGEINSLYDKFKKTLKDDRTFDVSLAEFATKHKLMDNIPELTEKFATKFVEENVDAKDLERLDYFRNLVRTQRKFNGPAFRKSEIYEVADKHGFFVTNEFGALAIRDVDSGEIVGGRLAHTTSQAIGMMEEMGMHPNPIKHDVGSSMNSSGVSLDGLPTPISQPHMQVWEPERADHIVDPILNKIGMYGNINDLSHELDLKWNKITGTNAFFEAIDNKNWALANEAPIKTDLKAKFFNPTQEAHTKTTTAIKFEGMNHPKVRQLDMYVRNPKLKITIEELEHVGHMLEAGTPDELKAPDGYAKGMTLSAKAVSLAETAHTDGVDLTKVNMYRRSIAANSYMAKEAAQKAALANMNKNILSGMAQEDAHAIFADESSAYESSPRYQQGLDRIQQIFKPDANFLKANNAIDGLTKEPDATAHLAGAVRLKMALDMPDQFGLSRADYITKNNIRPEVVKVHDMVKELYDDFGHKFGIDDSRKIMRYMNHYRQFGDIQDTYAIGDFERGIMDAPTRQFASAMIRTGEIGNYSMNPITNLYSYIRGGFKAQHIYRTLNEMGEVDGVLHTELNKITDPNIKSMVMDRISGYQKDLTGQIHVDEKTALAAYSNYLRHVMKDASGAEMTTADIIAEMQRPSSIDTMLALSSAGLLGGRISLAMRDNVDMWSKFYIKHGAERFSQLMRTSVSPKRLLELERDGSIVNPEGADVYNISSGPVNSFARGAANLGFKASLQGHYYLKNQGAVFEHTMKFTQDVLKDMDRGIIKDKKAAYKELFLNGYDEGTQRVFNAFVNDHMYEAAARTLAKEEVREMVGTFTKGNQPPILNSIQGKLFGQMASWGMTNRSVLQNLLSRGTREELVQRYVRFGISTGALMTAGSAAGISLGRWLLMPTGMIATGGPVLAGLQNITGLVPAELGGTEQQQRFTERQTLTSLKQFVPFSYAATDLGKAVDLAQNSTYGPGSVAMQAAGIQVDKGSRNFLDYVMGNYPQYWGDQVPGIGAKIANAYR